MNYHGIASHFATDDAAGTSRTLDNFVEEFAIAYSKGTGETTAKGSTAQEFVAGHYGAELTLSGVYDDTATTGPSVVMTGLVKAAAAADFEIGMGGGAAAKRKLSGVAIWTDYQESSPLEGAVKWTAKATVSGAVTEGVFS